MAVSPGRRIRPRLFPLLPLTSYLSRFGFLLRELPHIHQPSGNRGSGRHSRTHEMGAAALALPALEVAVRGRGAPLAAAEHVIVHAQAHRAPGIPPLEPRLAEHPVQAL